MQHPNHDLIALGVQQPWAELILRGIKTVEVRTLSTRRRGTIYLYASRKPSSHPAAAGAIARHRLQLDALPCGVLVGTVDIADSAPCTAADAPAACLEGCSLDAYYGWRLTRPHRFKQPLPVRFLPYGVWFYPFKRKHSAK